MAIINSFPIGTPKTNDLLVGTSMPDVNTDNDPRTVNFSVSDVIALVPDPPQAITLTTNGTSGASTLVGGVLNVPNYTTSGGVNSVTAGTNIVVSPTAGDVVVSAPNAIVNTTDTFGGPTVVNIVCLTSAQYPPATVDGNTLYVII